MSPALGRSRSPSPESSNSTPESTSRRPVETPVYATAEGVVAFASQGPVRFGNTWWRFGNVVMVENGPGFVTVYGHNNQIDRTGTRQDQQDAVECVSRGP